MARELATSLKPLVSIVIVNWNGLDDTKLCLEHTEKQTYKNIEIIVVDNGSTDGSVEYLRKRNGLILVENPSNLGFTGGHIAGYRVSHGEFILLLNNDAVMDYSYIERSIDKMQDDTAIGALGGRAYLWDDGNGLFDTTNNFYSYQQINPITAEGIFAREDSGSMREVNTVSGSCVMVRRSVIEQIGYLHDPFFAYYEEADLFARMKRAGHKVVYEPSLAIWHANAKTSNRKAPTFFYYMMMRNRFRFAVRNFDSWSLRKFLRFYLVMGITSTLKSLLPLSSRPMHQAYARAFYYNVFRGWRAITERRKLINNLGVSNYNQLIVGEQNSVSFIVDCENNQQAMQAARVAGSLGIDHELIVVSRNKKILNDPEDITDGHANLRLCIDREYFKTHRENIGAVCAKNDWLMIVRPDELNYIEAIVKELYKLVYQAHRKSAALAVFSNAGKLGLPVYRKQLFIDCGGLLAQLDFDDARRSLMEYARLIKTYLEAPTTIGLADMPAYTGKLKLDKLRRLLLAMHHRAMEDRRQATFIQRLEHRYYRFHQLLSLMRWTVSPKIPLRLKAARTKNLFVYLFKLKRRALAIELKHIRNETVLHKFMPNHEELEAKQAVRLDELIKKPEQTTIFIISRDRYSYLCKLINWLEDNGLKRIVLIDNDSSLPPLLDYYARTDYQLLELGKNMTQTAPWSAGIIKILLPDDFYIVTDPDIIPSAGGKETLSHLYRVHKNYPEYLKVGLGLKIDDLPEYYDLKPAVIKWESQFWKHQLEEGVFEAGVDTTFATYKPYTYQYTLHPSLRTGEPYTARHLPWYTHSEKLTDEDVFYRLRLDQNVNSWDKEHLPERYKKELEKQRH